MGVALLLVGSAVGATLVLMYSVVSAALLLFFLSEGFQVRHVERALVRQERSWQDNHQWPCPLSGSSKPGS